MGPGSSLSSVTRVGILEISLAFVVTTCCLYYVYLHPAYDLVTLMIGVVLPVVFGSTLLLLGRQRVLFFVFLAYFWSLVDDAPVHFDSVLTWPRVTHYQPIVPYFGDYVLLVVVLSSFCLAVRESLKRRTTTPKEKALFGFLTLVVFGLSYIQDIEVPLVQNIVARYWYQLDLVEHLASAAILVFFLKLVRLLTERHRFPTVSSTGEDRGRVGGPEVRPARWVIGRYPGTHVQVTRGGDHIASAESRVQLDGIVLVDNPEKGRRGGNADLPTLGLILGSEALGVIAFQSLGAKRPT